MVKVLTIYSNLEKLQKRFIQAAHKKEALLKLIAEAEVAEQVYNSNAIENSTVTLEETEKILLELDLNRFVSQRELFETHNLAKVVEYIASKASVEELTQERILLLHKMLLSNIQDDIAGRFRTKDEWVRVGTHIALDPQKVVLALEKMFLDFHMSTGENIIKRIAHLHLEFESIHPFMDGNGRIGRVINNYLLIRAGHVPINIQFADRSRYYQAFKEYNQSKSTGIMEELVGKALTSSYHKRLAYLEGKEIILLVDYAKRNKLSHPNLINKAKRQSIEAFKEKGKWWIGA